MNHSQWLAISTAYRKGPSIYHLMLIGPNNAWSLEFDHHALPSNMIGAGLEFPSLVLDLGEALVHSSPEARSLMDASTRSLVERMETPGTMAVEAVAAGRRNLYGTLTFHPEQSRGASGTTQPAAQPVPFTTPVEEPKPGDWPMHPGAE